MLIYRLLVGIVVILHLSANNLFTAGTQSPEMTLDAFAHSILTGSESAIELVCAGLVLIGLLTRVAAVPPMLLSVIEIVSGKLQAPNFRQIFFGENTADYQLGAWSIVHDVYGAFIILFGCVFLFFDGAGRPSVDAAIMDRILARRPIPPPAPERIRAES